MRIFCLILMLMTTFGSVCDADVQITGIEAKALNVAVVRFNADFKGQYDLKNYYVKILKEKSQVHVHFVPHRAEADKGKRGGQTSLGREVSYYVRTKDLKITKRTFYR